MKDRTYLLNTILAAVVGIAMLAIMLVHTFLPAFIIPKVNIPNIALLCLVALTLEGYIAPGAKRCYICIPVFSAITFGLLPWAAGYIAADSIWVLAISGGVIFTLLTWLYTSICRRLSSGPATKLAPLACAVGMYLAVQCFTGIIL